MQLNLTHYINHNGDEDEDEDDYDHPAGSPENEDNYANQLNPNNDSTKG